MPKIGRSSGSSRSAASLTRFRAQVRRGHAAGGDGAHGGQEKLACRPLAEHAAGTGDRRGDSQLAACEAGEDEDPGGPVVALELAAQREAVAVGQPEVGDHDVGLRLVERVERRVAARHRADGPDAVLRVEQADDARADDRVVVDGEDADHAARVARPRGARSSGSTPNAAGRATPNPGAARLGRTVLWWRHGCRSRTRAAGAAPRASHRAIPLFWRLFMPNAAVLVAACVLPDRGAAERTRADPRLRAGRDARDRPRADALGIRSAAAAVRADAPGRPAARRAAGCRSVGRSPR